MAERVGFEPTERARRINNLLESRGFTPLGPVAYPHLALAKAELSSHETQAGT